MTKSQLLDKIKELVGKLNFYLSSDDHIILWQGNKYLEIENKNFSFFWERDGSLVWSVKDELSECWLSKDDDNDYCEQDVLNCLNDLNRFKVINKTDIKSIL